MPVISSSETRKNINAIKISHVTNIKNVKISLLLRSAKISVSLNNRVIRRPFPESGVEKISYTVYLTDPQELVLLQASVSIRHLLTRCDKKFVP